MTDTSRKRDPRYTRTVGEKPNQGRRYVENGKVRIEWFEDDKRRSRTIGDNSADTRREADEELERLLGLTEADLDAEEECDEECFVVDISWLVEGFRSNAEKIMDLADDLAESFEKGLVNVMSVFDRSDDDDDDDDDVEDAEIVDEDDDDEESKGTE
jgi:hypothetical protein